MSGGSLAFRAILAALCWIALALLAGGWAVSELHGASVARQFDERLAAQLDLLTSAVFRNPGDPAAAMTSPSFARVYSGWYWSAEEAGGARFRSRSLWDGALAFAPAGGAESYGDIDGPDAQRLRAVGRRVIAGRASWRLIVAADRARLDAERAAFRASLLIYGAALGLCLLIAAALLLRSALAPLGALRAAVAARGAAGEGGLKGAFPSEVRPLVADLDQLLDKNERLRRKARAQAAELAHALKTPAAILRNEFARAKGGGPVDFGAAEAAIDRIAVAADRHLARASAGRDAVGDRRADAMAVARDIARAIRRLAPERRIALDGPERLPLAMDLGDLQEILGNLMENAAKWSTSRIRAEISEVGGDVEISVHDDGPGIPMARRAALLAGEPREPGGHGGHGLGLAIVADVAALYDGALAISDSPLGGARVAVKLPALAIAADRA